MANIKTWFLAVAALSMTAVLVLHAAPAVNGAGNATLSVSPSSQNVMSGIADYGGVPGKGHPGVFTVAIHQNADVTTLGAQTDVSFDDSLLKITGVAMGAAYTTPDAQALVAGVAPQTVNDAITEANTTGLLKNLAVAFVDPNAGTVASGDAEALVITMETLPLASGASAITLTNTELNDVNGDPVTMGSPTNGTVNVSISPDRDGDGCPDVKEQNGTVGSQNAGGLRDFQNPYDYFNPTHDHVNRVDDILAVVNKYFADDSDGNPGLPPYAVGYTPVTDRTAIIGGDPWDLLRGNGIQRVDDILAIVKQYFHDCS